MKPANIISIAVALLVLWFGFLNQAQAGMVSTGALPSPVRCLAIPQNNPQKIYAGTDQGIYRSINGGTSWSAVNVGLPSFNGYAIAIDPSNSSILYAGLNGGGIYKSTNGGDSWSSASVGMSNDYGIIFSIAISPLNSQIVYAGTWTNVFKSINGGASWTAVSTGLPAGGMFLAMDPENSQTVYAGTTNGVYKTTNGGTTWVAVNNGLSGSPLRVGALAMDPSNSLVLYAATEDDVFKSIDGGAHWFTATPPMGGRTVCSFAIDRANGQHVYAGATGGSLYKSTDGGANWCQVPAELGLTTINTLALDPSNSQTIYLGTWDVGVIKGTNIVAGACNGFCGSANDTTLAIKPAASLCRTGSATAVTGAGPWTWNCNGSNGGENAYCVANIKSGAYTLDDLKGKWESHRIASSGPYWERGTLTVLANGSFSGTTMNSQGQTRSVSASFAITEDGVVTPSGRQSRCVMDAARTLLACTATSQDGNSAEMEILTKKGSGYLPTDLAGTWDMGTIATPGKWAGKGQFVIGSDGKFSGTLSGIDGSTNSYAGALQISADGIVSITASNLPAFDQSSMRCALDSARTVMVCTNSHASSSGDSSLIIYTKRGTSYTTSDLTGVWRFSNIIAPQAWWGRGVLNFTTDGSFTGNMNGSGRDNESVSGKVSIDAQGGIGPLASVMCSMDALKRVWVCASTADEDDDANLLVLTSTSGYRLTATRSGFGIGAVSAAPAGIVWSGTTGTAGYKSGTVVTLTAAAAAGSLFTGWSGACTGSSATCTITMNAMKTVAATFSDIAKPSISAFSIPTTSVSATVPISSLTASDNVAVTGYLLSTSSATPLASATGWTGTKPVSYTFAGLTAGVATTRTLYAFVKDAANNISLYRSDAVTITKSSDLTKPVISVFAIPASSVSATVPISTLAASDNIAVTGYFLSTSATTPSPYAVGWSASKPVGYTFTGLTAGVATTRTLYAFVKDAANNISLYKSAAVTITKSSDLTKPVISAFTIPASSISATVPISTLTASDNIAVTGYFLSTSATTPTPYAVGWSAAKPRSYTFAGLTTGVAATRTLYAFVKDAANNISLYKSDAVTITKSSDLTKPVISAFAIPASSVSATVPISTLTASDNIAVTGYFLSISAATPTPYAVGWSAGKPVGYTFTGLTAGVAATRTLYAFVKDAANNISLYKSDAVTITLPVAKTAAKALIQPPFAISTLDDGATTDNPVLNISGVTTSAGGLAINGSPIPVTEDGSFSHALTLATGSNTVTVTVARTDAEGAIGTDIRTVTRSSGAPLLSITEPADNSSTSESFISIKGSSPVTNTVTSAINGSAPQAALRQGDSFETVHYLVEGINTVVIKASDVSGQSGTAKRTVTYNPVKPSLAILEPATDIITSKSSYLLKGQVGDALTAATVQISVDGSVSKVTVTAGGSFEKRISLTAEKQHRVTVTATGQSGASVTVQRNIIYKKGL